MADYFTDAKNALGNGNQRRLTAGDLGIAVEISDAENLFQKVNATFGFQKCPYSEGYDNALGSCQSCIIGRYNLKNDDLRYQKAKKISIPNNLYFQWMS